MTFKKLTTLQQVELDMKMRRLREQTKKHEVEPHKEAKRERQARRAEALMNRAYAEAAYDCWMATRDW